MTPASDAAAEMIILDTYGKFPGTVDAVYLMWFMQIHHLDLEFYDGFSSQAVTGEHTATTWRPGIREAENPPALSPPTR
jgi:hypothetical protein